MEAQVSKGFQTNSPYWVNPQPVVFNMTEIDPTYEKLVPLKAMQ